MICVVDCGKCKHQRNLLDGWRPCCDAFPDGIPMNFDFSRIKKIEECNNGISFEEKESK